MDTVIEIARTMRPRSMARHLQGKCGYVYYVYSYVVEIIL